MQLYTAKSILSVAIVALWLTGCSGSTLVPVEGTVTLDGKPLAGATVGLELVGGEKDFRLFTADTDAAGKYTIKPFESGGEGALPGEYRIMIKSVKAPPGANEWTVVPPDPVPAEYQHGLRTLTVPVEGITNADFFMTTRKR